MRAGNQTSPGARDREPGGGYLHRLRPRARRNAGRLVGGGVTETGSVADEMPPVLEPPKGRAFVPSAGGRVVVSTGNTPANMFGVDFWSSFSPLCFPYGDAVFGIERAKDVSYDEWAAYLMQRDELDYPSSFDKPEERRDHLPRWRGDRDLQTVLYCLWRRRAYIRSARLFAKKEKWEKDLKEIGRLTADEMYETLEILGRGAGIKDAISNADVPDRI